MIFLSACGRHLAQVKLFGFCLQNLAAAGAFFANTRQDSKEDDLKTMRADQVLLCRGLAASRTQAQRMIACGRVLFSAQNKPVQKASQQLAEDEILNILPDASDAFVSRGGVKLAGALARCAVDVSGLVALDLGISTGGFSDCLLQAGARKILGVDVGHGQLAEKLRQDARVILFEGVNARAPDFAAILAHNDGAAVDFAVCDVSFISLRLILPTMPHWLKTGADILFLVKPQFEVGREFLGRGGLVKDARRYAWVKDEMCDLARSLNFDVLDYFDSPILGGDGNREFFLWAKFLG